MRPETTTTTRRSWQQPTEFAELFRRHAPEVQRFVVRRLGADAAADVVAETFLVAFRQREGYDAGRGAGGSVVWLSHAPNPR